MPPLLRYAGMNPSSNVFVIGPSGAGKTSIGRRVAAHYGLAFLDLDEEIEARTGVDIPTIFDIEQEAGFRVREATLLDELTRSEGTLLATGAGAILAAENRERLTRRGFVVWLDAGVAQQLMHLAHDRQRPLLATTDRRGRLEAMARVRTPLYEATADLRIPLRRESLAQATRRAVRALDAAWSRPATGAALP